MTVMAMTTDEREAFLAAVHVGVLSVARKEKAPLTVPIWYRYEPGGELSILIGPDSLKAKLLARAGRFSLCVQTESVPYRYVSVEGPVCEIVHYDLERDLGAMAARYLGEEGRAGFIDGMREKYGQGNGIKVTIRPEAWLSADYSKA